MKSLKLEPDEIKVKKNPLEIYNLINFPTVRAGFHYLGYFSPLGLSFIVKFIVFIQHKGTHNIISILNVQDMTENEKSQAIQLRRLLL